MQSLLSSFILVLSLLFITTSQAESGLILDQRHLPAEFSTEQWREIYLELTKSPPPLAAQIVNPPIPGTREAKLIDFFQTKIEPELDKLSHISSQYYGLMLLVDSGLYSTPEEMNQWTLRMQELLAIYSAHETDEVWQNNVRIFGTLAEGINGDLAKFAKKMSDELDLNSYPQALSAQVEELNLKNQQITETASQLVSKDNALKSEAQANQVIDAYFKGKIDFASAAKRLETLTNEGYPKVGAELIEKAGEPLQRTALLRSQLAKAKGFKSWADLQVARQAASHGKGFRTAEDLLKFLYELLDATDSTARRIYEQAAARQGRTIESLRPAEMRLLLKPAEFYVYGYFQKEKIESVWRETMAASGFTQDLTRRVLIDAFPRENKQGHAYMLPARMASIKQPQIDGNSLDFIIPSDNSPLWERPITSIVQNFNDNNIENVRTMFHEGGHSLDFSAQRPGYADTDSYGYSETHSTTMEHFATDLEFLRHYAMNEKNERPSPETIESYLRESSFGDLMGFRGNVAQAIFDLELWSYDYNQKNSAKLWRRAIRINKRLSQRLRFVPLPEDMIVSRGQAYFSTSHFYGGSVRYFGYVLAEVSAEMIANHLLDRLEKTTGRRSLFQQPSIAPILTQLYRHGPKQQFPQSIETFTGQTFSAQSFARGLTERVNIALDSMAKAPPSCDDQLLVATNPGKKSKEDMAATPPGN